MTFEFSVRSRDRMQGLHPDIVAVMELAIQRTPIDFTVLEGMRTVERQRALVARGASKTMNSRHLTGHAIDIAPLLNGKVSWDWPLYHQLAPVIKQAARDLGVSLEWGGDWKNFKDGPHWQLSWGVYGKTDKVSRARPTVLTAAEVNNDFTPRADWIRPNQLTERPKHSEKQPNWIARLFANLIAWMKTRSEKT